MVTSTPNKLPRPSALKQYAEAGWQFVPLHHWAEKRQLPPTAKNPQGRLLELGKAPVGKAWTKHGVDLKKATTHANAGKNVGAMIPPGWAVIDVDPRNFKGEDNSWDRLQADIGFDLSKYAAVKTGSGGWHVFVRIPLDYKGVVKIEAYPGIEFKQIGVQVVAAGSIHPKTQDYYVWMDAAVSLADTGEAPAKLLELYKVTRPLISGSDGGDTWGSLTVEQIEEGLGLLDTTLFKEQDYWFGLMCSVHWLSGGEARQQFIEWSAQDNEFADQMDTVAARWDSLGRGSASAQLVARGGQFFKALKTHAGIQVPNFQLGDVGFHCLREREVAGPRQPRQIPEDVTDFLFDVLCIEFVAAEQRGQQVVAQFQCFGNDADDAVRHRVAKVGARVEVDSFGVAFVSRQFVGDTFGRFGSVDQQLLASVDVRLVSPQTREDAVEGSWRHHAKVHDRSFGCGQRGPAFVFGSVHGDVL